MHLDLMMDWIVEVVREIYWVYDEEQDEFQLLLLEVEVGVEEFQLKLLKEEKKRIK
jgi:predicted thioredoxin/glutaredoxin